MSTRFIKFIPSEESDWLIIKKPNAFKLLYFIAKRARRTFGSPDGLEIGEAQIGDWDSMGMTRQEYRTALSILEGKNFIRICETNRTRKKSTTGSTTEGTKVKILNASIWDINEEKENHRVNHCPTTAQPLPNHEQERKELKNVKDTYTDVEESAVPYEVPSVVSSSVIRLSSTSEEENQTLEVLYQFAMSREWVLTRDDVSKWLHYYGEEKTRKAFDYIIETNAVIEKSHARYLQSCLMGDYAGKKERVALGRSLAMKVKMMYNLKFMVLMEDYWKDAENNDEQHIFNTNLGRIYEEMVHVCRKKGINIEPLEKLIG